jgi:N-methylhydantoinase B
VRLETPGGGGYGPVAERDPAAIERDVKLGFVTPEAAADTYNHPVKTSNKDAA